MKFIRYPRWEYRESDRVRHNYARRWARLIPKIEAIFRKDFEACDYQEDGQKEGELATFFVIARSEKAEFMKGWMAAKAGI